MYLGEYDLGTHYPAEAIQLFKKAGKILPGTSPFRGLARFDIGVAAFISGRFKEARDTLSDLLKSKMGGYDRRIAPLYLGSAKAHEGERELNRAAGIPEPDRFDPMCAVYGMAVCLKGRGLPFDLATVTKKVPHDGEGTSLQQLVDCAPALGLEAAAVPAEEKTLRVLEMPVIVHAENHFVAVTRADDSGVAYVCSDCGPFPGGEVHLSWKQWRMLAADSCLALSKSGSPAGWALAHLPAEHPAVALPELAAKTRPTSRISAEESSGIPILAALRGPSAAEEMVGEESVATRTWAAVTSPGAGSSAARGALKRLLAAGVTGWTPTPLHACGMRAMTLQAYPWAPHVMYEPNVASWAPQAGDPVDLGNGEEIYGPEPDLIVNNPIGPSVVFQRYFLSFGDQKAAGMGSGWSHSYNYRIFQNTVAGTRKAPIFVFPNDSRLSLTVSQTTPPTQSNPDITMGPVTSGPPMSVHWKWDGGTSSKFEVTMKDRSVWTFGHIEADDWGPGTGQYVTDDWCPTKIADAVGNYITLTWSHSQATDIQDRDTNHWTGPLLSRISDQNGNPIFGIDYTTKTPNPQYGPSGFHMTVISQVFAIPNASVTNVSSVNAATTYYSGRTYDYGYFQCTNVDSGGSPNPQGYWMLTKVSQLGTVSVSGSNYTVNASLLTSNLRYQYDYSNFDNMATNSAGQAEAIPFLTTIKVPNVAGGAQATATIDYDHTYGYIKSITDSAGNVTKLNYLGTNTSDVQILDNQPDLSPPNIFQHYFCTFNSNLLPTSTMRTRSTAITSPPTFAISSNVYSSPNCWYEPSSV